ncbi:hypothetical protein MAR_021696, partial [Mya arenaria]
HYSATPVPGYICPDHQLSAEKKLAEATKHIDYIDHLVDRLTRRPGLKSDLHRHQFILTCNEPFLASKTHCSEDD